MSKTERRGDPMRDNPFLIAVLGFAGGFLAGALAPATRAEVRHLGPVGGELRQRGLRGGERLAKRARTAVEDRAP